MRRLDDRRDAAWFVVSAVAAFVAFRWLLTYIGAH